MSVVAPYPCCIQILREFDYLGKFNNALFNMSVLISMDNANVVKNFLILAVR